MTKTTCGAPRCKRPARWGLTDSTEAETPEMLCPQHWHKLRQESPLVAVLYCPISLRQNGRGPKEAVVRAKTRRPAGESIARQSPESPEMGS